MTPNSEPDANPNQPIDEINWWDALLFANAYSHAMGLPPCYLVSGCGFPSDSQFRCDDVQINHPSNNPLNCEGFRLPTDAEWEYAYRAGTTTAFYNGPITELFNAPVDPTLDEIAWYAGNRDGDLQTVARKLPNAWGLYDMAGNVLEWCWDGLRFYDGATTDPLGPQEDVWRILRGGNIYNAPPRARAAWRGDNPFTARGVGVGFRLARTCASEDCDVPLCPPGFADCNGDPADGCETRLNNNSASCGACDTACDAPHHADVCLQGVCLLRPDTSWKLCTRRLMWGLEAVNTATDPAHCGACDAPCAPLETCEEGICVSVP
jgi:sulfatase modifying factor 1